MNAKPWLFKPKNIPDPPGTHFTPIHQSMNIVEWW